MKNNIKSLELVEKGLSPKTVSKLTESQISVLHSKLINEQVRQEKKVVTKTTIPTSTLRSTGANVDGISIHMDPSGNVVASQTEGELGEGGKKQKKNPWAICTSQLGDEFGTTERSEWSDTQLKKYERCVRDVKKSLKESQNDVSSFLENKIVDLLEKYLPPKITKGDLIKYLVEDSPAVAPKPGTKEPKPGTKEPPKPTKTPAHPGKNPNPKVNPAPKAKRIDPEVAKEKIIDTIMKMLENEKN